MVKTLKYGRIYLNTWGRKYVNRLGRQLEIEVL